ncbi:MAG: roadblock/LC7 domain-containing protein [Nocardioides sp.]|nr:roadblock/LC7 domain-containing protein [Nocardioides sp.]
MTGSTLPSTQQLTLLTTAPVQPTPAGAFRAVASAEPDPLARMLLATMTDPVSPMLNEGNLLGWTGLSDVQEAMHLLLAAQEDALIEAVTEQAMLPNTSLEDLMPPLLEGLSQEGKALVADPDGLPMWTAGFDADSAARVAAMSADLASLRERHVDTIEAVLGDAASAWALVDGVGASRMGSWPLHIGGTRFELVTQGLPRMHHSSFTYLVWLLVHRYG